VPGPRPTRIDDDGELHGARRREPLHDRRDGRRLLTDRDVDADDALALLVDDRVDGDGGLAGAAVADDQLALSAPDRDHRVDGLDARLQGLLHRLTNDDARRLALDLPRVARVDVALAVDRTAQRVHDATDELGADRHFEHASRAANLVALLQLEVVAEDDGADVVLLEIQREGRDGVAGLAREHLEHLARHRLLQSVDASDPVLHLEDGSDLLDVELVEVGSFDLPEEDVLDLAGAERGFGSHTSGQKGATGAWRV
jgi:hypothetical protein